MWRHSQWMQGTLSSSVSSSQPLWDIQHIGKNTRVGVSRRSAPRNRPGLLQYEKAFYSASVKHPSVLLTSSEFLLFANHNSKSCAIRKGLARHTPSTSNTHIPCVLTLFTTLWSLRPGTKQALNPQLRGWTFPFVVGGEEGFVWVLFLFPRPKTRRPEVAVNLGYFVDENTAREEPSSPPMGYLFVWLGVPFVLSYSLCRRKLIPFTPAISPERRTKLGSFPLRLWPKLRPVPAPEQMTLTNQLPLPQTPLNSKIVPEIVHHRIHLPFQCLDWCTPYIHRYLATYIPKVQNLQNSCC